MPGSETIERLLRERLGEEAARRAREREVAQINRHAEALNAAAADVLAYQEEGLPGPRPPSFYWAAKQ